MEADAAKLDILGARREKLKHRILTLWNEFTGFWKMQNATGHCRLLA